MHHLFCNTALTTKRPTEYDVKRTITKNSFDFICANYADLPTRKRPRYARSTFLRWPRKSSLFDKLRNRELASEEKIGLDSLSLKNYQLTEKIDVHDTAGEDVKLSFLQKRSKVVEILTVQELVMGLTETGICSVVKIHPYKKLCFMNIIPDEVVRSLFYNKSNHCLITVSVTRQDDYSSLKCRSTSIDLIRAGTPEKGTAIFESESLRWPGFIEFDDVNKKVLTYSASSGAYKLWDLASYDKLYVIDHQDIREVKISPGIVLLIHNRHSSGGKVPLKILDIEDGRELKSFEYEVNPHRKLDFIEQFNEKLLIKQEKGDLHIADILTGEKKYIVESLFATPTAFIFLYEQQLFLTFWPEKIAVWNFHGEQITKFEDHMPWYPNCNTNNIYITSNQNRIISYCKNSIDHDRGLGGTINVSDIHSGKCIAKIAPANATARPGLQRDIFKSLQDVHAIYYDEETGNIITGSDCGHLYIWSP